MVERYPFFVYGTLIPGQVNDFYWGDCIGDVVPAIFSNGLLFDMGSFPMLLEDGDKAVKGQVMFPDENLSVEDYQLLVQRLDTLENYNPDDSENSPYYRVLRTVRDANERTVTAWVYLGRPIYTYGRSPIPGGDWVSYSAGVQSDISVWWEERGRGLLFSGNRNDIG